MSGFKKFCWCSTNKLHAFHGPRSVFFWPLEQTNNSVTMVTSQSEIPLGNSQAGGINLIFLLSASKVVGAINSP